MGASIAAHAIIGDCRSAALITGDGTIDWLCWPRFDAPSIFGALLDEEKGGRFRVGPAGACSVSRRYLPRTNVLETTFTTPGGGELVLVDLMPVSTEAFKQTELLPDHELLRIARCTKGAVELEVEFDPRPNYGLGRREVLRRTPFGLRTRVYRGVLDLASSMEIGPDGRWHGVLREGEEAILRLTYTVDKPQIHVPLEEARSELKRSIEWWSEWASHVKYDGPWREQVIRSALALKLLIYAPSGGVVAAPTTSLPEWIGGGFNWDYRYCWPRDGALIVRALLGLGFPHEAEAFVSWLLHTTRLTRPRIGVLYDVFGCTGDTERNLPLAGYRGSRPVRIGNAARTQEQLDVYGEVVDATTRWLREGGDTDRETESMLTGFGEYVCDHWSDPDAGIWEFRTGPYPHTHSRVLCWATLDRLLELHGQGMLKRARAERYAEVRKQIRETVEAESWNEHLQSYTQVPGKDEVDAALLLLPFYGFESARSVRMQGTWRRIRSQLEAGRGFFYRYKTEQPEGTFGICGFWAIDFLARGGGTLREAEETLESLVEHANDLGLLAEETNPATGEALGNFPQGLTHVGLINAALTIEQRRRQEVAR